MHMASSQSLSASSVILYMRYAYFKPALTDHVDGGLCPIPSSHLLMLDPFPDASTTRSALSVWPFLRCKPASHGMMYVLINK
jgi:hypothetical protein